MRFVCAYYFLILYAAGMFQPAMPAVADFIGHTFANEWHIANVHMKYGNDHLEKELQTASKENNSGKNQTNFKSGEYFAVHLIISESIIKADRNINIDHFAFEEPSYFPDPFSKVQAQPPQYFS